MPNTFDTLGTLSQPELISFFADLRQQLSLSDWNSLKDTPQAIEKLNELGLGPAHKNEKGATLLHYVFKLGSLEIIEALIAIGFDIHVKNEVDYNILHYAVMGGHVDIINIFKNRGLNLHELNKNGHNSAHVVASCGYVELLPILEKEWGVDLHAVDIHGAGVMLHACAVPGDITIETLIKKGWDVYVNNKDEASALHYAALYGNNKLIETLIRKYGFKPTQKDKNNQGILYWAQQESKNQATIDLCNDTTYLNNLYHQYLTSFILPPIPHEVGAAEVVNIMAQYATPMEHQEIFERHLEQCLKERLSILQPLRSFCDSPANEEDEVARGILNKLLEERNITLQKTEENLDALLADGENQGKAYYYPLLLCRLEAVKYTGHLPTASDNVLYLQAQLALAQQNNSQLNTAYDALKESHKELQASHDQLENSSSFYFNCLLALSSIGCCALTIGIIALCTLTPVGIGVGVVLTTVGAISSGLALYGLYKHSQRAAQPQLEEEIVLEQAF